MLPTISRSKGNETVKFGQLTEYNKRNIFFLKCDGETILRLFPKNTKWSISLDQYTVCLYCMPS